MNTTVADLSKFRIPGSNAYYVPNFVTNSEEEYMIRKILESPRQKWKQLTNRRLQVWGGEITPKNVLLAHEMPPFIDKYPNIIARLRATGAYDGSPHGGPNHVIINEYLPGQGIMPHEDGPTYHPVVATISLGSRTVFHYYQYREGPLPLDTDSPSPAANAGEGRPINPIPVLSVLLEPRSVIITNSSLYTSHLHGIQEVEEDIVSPRNGLNPPLLAGLEVPVANWNMLVGEEERRIMEEGGILRRETRYSLTCRDVERVTNAKSFLRR